MRRSTCGRWLPALLACALLGACRQETPAPETSASSKQAARAAVTNGPGAELPGTVGTQTNQRVFLVKGVIRDVLANQNKVRIAHERIPGFMEAMTMVFDVKDPKELGGIAPGDAVSFRMIVTPEAGWIDTLVNVEGTNAPAPVLPPPFRVVRDVEPLNLGDPVPNYQFTNHLGRLVSLRDFRGQAVAITFFYTRCQFPNFCPRMSGNFAAVQARMKAMKDAPDNWHLLSVSFDPEFDTPRVLAFYSRQYQTDPARWEFLTGPLIDITAIAEQLGMFFWRSDPAQPASIDHNLVTAVLDPQGRLHTVLTGNEWKVDYLVSEIVKAARSAQ